MSNFESTPESELMQTIVDTAKAWGLTGKQIVRVLHDENPGTPDELARALAREIQARGREGEIA